MGYRYYIYEVNNDVVKDLKACKNDADVKNVCEKYQIETEDGYLFLPDIAIDNLFEFGKECPAYDKIHGDGTDWLFDNEEVRESFKDYSPIILDLDKFTKIIQWYRTNIINFYKKAFAGGVDRMKYVLSELIMWWEFGGVNMDMECEAISSSWLYEHEIFELVRIMKTFDWKNKTMVMMGW